MNAGIEAYLSEYAKTRKNTMKRIKRLEAKGLFNLAWVDTTAVAFMQKNTKKEIRAMLQGLPEKEAFDRAQAMFEKIKRVSESDYTTYKGALRSFAQTKSTLEELGYNVGNATPQELAKMFSIAYKVLGDRFDYRIAVDVMEKAASMNISIGDMLKSDKIKSILTGRIKEKNWKKYV